MVGLRRGYTFMEELLGLAKPFGKLVKHLVLDLKPEVDLVLSLQSESNALIKDYRNKCLCFSGVPSV